MWRTFSTAPGGFPMPAAAGPAGNPWPARPAVTRSPYAAPPESATAALPVAMPDLVGLTPQDARRVARLSGLHLMLHELPVEHDLRGRILAQEPMAGSPLGLGQLVSATIGARPAVAIPDLRGIEEQEALAFLRASGLDPSRRIVRRSNDVEPGAVIRTRPRAGTEVPVGTRVAVMIASALRPERVSARPDVRRHRARRLPDGTFLSMPTEE